MNPEQREKIQFVQFSIAKAFDEFCSNNDINYWLEGGSLLGAVRHEGPIPWDDDFDVAMLRKDYEKFLRLFKQTQDNSLFFIQNWDSDKFYPHVFSKMGLKGSVYKEEAVSKTNFNQAIFIDIFPYDNAPNSVSAQKVQKYSTRFLRKIYSLKTGVIPHSSQKKVAKKIIYSILLFLGKLFRKDALKKRLYKTATKYQFIDTEYIYSVGTSYKYEKKLIPKEWVLNTTRVQYKNYKFAAPKQWEKYLTHIFGDYKKLPAKEKQVGGHDIISFDVGENFTKLN